MPFKQILQNLVEAVPGATGAVFADWEGEAVEQFSRYDEYDIKVTGAHKGIILDRLRSIPRGSPPGDVEDIVVTSGDSRIVIVPVGPEYLLVMTADGRAGAAGSRMDDDLEVSRCVTVDLEEVVAATEGPQVRRTQPFPGVLQGDARGDDAQLAAAWVDLVEG